MDRLAQTALTALRQMQDNKFDLANNLANVNVPGFRRDLPNEGNAGFLKELDKLSAKVLPLETEARKFSNEAGQLQNTGLETDVAVLNEGFFYIQPKMVRLLVTRRLWIKCPKSIGKRCWRFSTFRWASTYCFAK